MNHYYGDPMPDARPAIRRSIDNQRAAALDLDVQACSLIEKSDALTREAAGYRSAAAKLEAQLQLLEEHARLDVVLQTQGDPELNELVAVHGAPIDMDAVRSTYRTLPNGDTVRAAGVDFAGLIAEASRQ